jgi:hypothetical protein
MSSVAVSIKTSRFQRVLASVEALSPEDQAALAEVVTKRASAQRRRQLGKDIAQARQDYHRGKVHRGTAADLMSELRR